ncbi:MAG: pepsin/retropepsin-like aspartic protease family protein [Pseudomonadota bacterium]
MAAVTEWIDIDIINGHVTVESSINGIKGYSIIDTGASGTSINGNFVTANNLTFGNAGKIVIQGIVAKEERPVYRGVEVSMFGTQLTFNNVADINFGGAREQLLLGADFLKGYVVQFDYVNSRMRLITRDSIDLKKQKNIKSKRLGTSGGIVVKVGLGKKDPWLMLDTGATSGLIVSRQLAERLDWPETYGTVTGESRGVNDSAETEYFRLPNMGLGPYNLEDVMVAYPAEGSDFKLFERRTASGSRLLQRNAYEGLVGYDVLKHFLVTVDYQRGYVHLAPGQKVTAE